MFPKVPQGYRLAGVYAGLKRNPNKLDVALIVSDRPAAAAGVYTQNLVFAAPVGLDRQRTPSAAVRAIAINSGNANACTGERGDRDAARMAELAAAGLRGETGTGAGFVDRRHRRIPADGKDRSRYPARPRNCWPTTKMP